ncbi:MAG: TolC family protein [Geobacteraceae bacterium]|nr:TolC family protein [Geobacteraceae bacterium]
MLPLLLNLAVVATASAESPVIRLSLKEAVRLALEQNLDLKAELYTPAQAEADIRKNRAIYETHLTLNTAYQDATPYSPVLGTKYDTNSVTLTPGAYQLLPTGGTLGLSYQNIRQQNSTVSPLGTYWTSNLGLTLSQPLLKNFGRDATELNIRVSEVSKETSISHLKSRILAVVAQVKSEYFRLVSFREDLESRKASLELAQKILSETEARVRAGVLPAMEILNAQFGVSSRQKDLIDAEKAVSDQVDILSQLIHLGRNTDIITTDRPDRGTFTLNEDDALNKSLAIRPELDELKGQLISFELQTKVSRNQTLPSLNLVSSLALTGIDKDFSRNSERMGSFDYPAWSIGLQFDYPLGNQSAENDYIKNRLKVEQTKVQIDSLRSSIENEVRLAIRAVNSSYKQLDVADRARLYADERVKAYMKKIEVGLATTKDLLDVENDLATARANQIKAEVLYATSLVQYWKSTGELLDREGIRIDSSKADAVYRGVK